MANECIPYFAGAKQLTAVAGTGGINGKRFVAGSGALAAGLGTDGGVPTVVLPAAGAGVAGVAAQDTAAGLPGGVWFIGVVPVTSSAAITVGPVMTDANGYCLPWTTGNQVAGYAIATAASGADAMIQLQAG